MNSRNYILTLILTLLSLTIYPQDVLTQLDSFSRYQLTLLDSSYKYNRTDLKELFFENWHNKIQDQKTSNDSSSSLRDDITHFFIEIFKPDTTCKRGYFEINRYDSIKKKVSKYKIQWNGCFAKADYIIVQTSVRLFVYNDSIFSTFRSHDFNKNYTKDSTINDFFPDASFLDKKRLFLTENYKKILNSFLISDQKKIDYWDSLIDKRRVFLQPEIELSKMHDGWFYHYLTFPEISHILFNQNYSKAIVEFRSSFNTGGNAFFEKVNSVWVMTKYNKENWIQ